MRSTDLCERQVGVSIFEISHSIAHPMDVLLVLKMNSFAETFGL
jgi:hypothetical protein